MLSRCQGLSVCSQFCVYASFIICDILNTPCFYKSVALTILELLAFNAQKFRGSHDPGHAPFQKILRSRVRTVPGNMPVKFEDHIPVALTV